MKNQGEWQVSVAHDIFPVFISCLPTHVCTLFITFLSEKCVPVSFAQYFESRPFLFVCFQNFLSCCVASLVCRLHAYFLLVCDDHTSLLLIFHSPAVSGLLLRAHLFLRAVFSHYVHHSGTWLSFLCVDVSSQFLLSYSIFFLENSCRLFFALVFTFFPFLSSP